MAEFFEMPDAEETVVEQTSILPDPVEEDALRSCSKTSAIFIDFLIVFSTVNGL